MSKLIDFESYPISPVLDRLLQDKTTKQNIIFATDAYLENGPDFAETAQITVDKLLGYMKIKIQPRVEKAAEEQLARTRKKAEVFTPSWIVNKMNNHCDEEWFGRPNVFNTEAGTSWVTSSAPITFDRKLSWKGYVDSKRLEITCGEAPYIVSRYDAATGDIIPIKDRIGILDRKLRVVSENAADDTEWLKWAERALQSSYGYEFQGDNLLIARGNVLHTFAEYYEARFAARPDIKLLRKVTNITLSVGQLTTGVTIPEWTAVLMLSNVKSPALYMQAAFRAQNPWMYCENGKWFRKENAYVFDFDPARTLTIFEEFANDLSSDTASGRGDMDTRKQHIRELLNFFPVIGEDEQGEMIALDAEKLLSIPRKIRSQEVVRRGFMSNYLFQNISGIFSAPQEVIDIISKFTPAEEPKAKDIPVTPNTKDELNINPETGDVEIPQEQVIGMAKDMFGDKIYATVADGTLDTQIKSAFDDAAAKSQDAAQSAFDDFKEKFKSETVKSIIDIAKEKYQENIRVSDAKALEKGLNSQFDRAANKVYNSYQIEQNTAESDRLDALRSRHETGKSEAEIEAEFEQKKKELQDGLQEQLSDAVKSFIETSTQSVVETTEKKIKEREKAGIEDSVRDHLRGFSRTIPSFLMAYGDDTVTLATFDAVIPNPVFLEVTSITLDQFRFLRDGGKYTDAETGEERDFAGNLFDPVVFDDSVKEFLRLKKKLADYFDEKSIEDIFDYIPPQKTNQIFTPKTMVKKMVDMLEAENPGCFDDPDKTFIDLYMKSGLYITEIVKRLYQSEQMKKQFPDPKERLHHIFEKQVYGLAPTEIIYHIALSYILGFNEDTKDIKHNFRQLDALPYAKEGTLQQKLDELFS